MFKVFIASVGESKVSIKSFSELDSMKQVHDYINGLEMFEHRLCYYVSHGKRIIMSGITHKKRPSK